ncbi:hypothetical protein PMAYCL1PPCAC_11081, partial [Pristionchus mayeri]
GEWRMENAFPFSLNNTTVKHKLFDCFVLHHLPVLGPFLLTSILVPLVEKAEEGRIVNVSSMGHYRSPPLDLGTIDNEDQFDTSLSHLTYNKSKLASVMHARELTHRLRAKGNITVTINSLHPGGIATEIFRDQGVIARFLMGAASFFLKSWKD